MATANKTSHLLLCGAIAIMILSLVFFAVGKYGAARANQSAPMQMSK